MKKRSKKITHAAKALLCLCNIGLFGCVWMAHYNSYVFPKQVIPGFIMSILLYYILYVPMCKLYKAFKIASNRVGETVISQFLSFSIADLVLYVECCVVSGKFVNILPGAATVVAQLVTTTLIVQISKRLISSNIQSQHSILIYGRNCKMENIEMFIDKLNAKYSHLYSIDQIDKEPDVLFKLDTVLKDFETVFLYEVSKHGRSKITQYVVKHDMTLFFTPSIEDITMDGCSERNIGNKHFFKYDYVYDKNPYFGKRFMDIFISLLGLTIASPFMILTAIAIKLEDGGPVFFRQKRYTTNGEVFDMIKFRSMRADGRNDVHNPATKNDSRITKVGAFIRKTRLDELPQLLTILKGDMSFVGPRPEPVELAEEYTEQIPEFSYRLRVKGGLTGYAQVYGKYNTSAYDKLRLDLIYIENQSLLLDIKLVLLTIKNIFSKDSAEGFADKEEKEENDN